MSELIEINEDNCVLDYNDMASIDTAFKYFIKHFEVYSDKHREKQNTRICFDGLFQKINKLNDLAKEKGK